LESLSRSIRAAGPTGGTHAASAAGRVANVGRSTFYEHFEGLDDVFRESIAPLLSVLAQAVAPEQPEALPRVIGHFWQNRRLSRVIFAGPTRPLMAGFLAELIAERSRRCRWAGARQGSSRCR
jgi:AcrR family transcriptional regulator